MAAIKEKDLINYRSAILVATDEWAKASKAEYEKNGDRGSCIIGDGIQVLVVPKGCRKPRYEMLISTLTVACCQGSSHYELTKDIALNILREAGLEVQYNYGRMD